MMGGLVGKLGAAFLNATLLLALALVVALWALVGRVQGVAEDVAARMPRLTGAEARFAAVGDRLATLTVRDAEAATEVAALRAEVMALRADLAALRGAGALTTQAVAHAVLRELAAALDTALGGRS